MGLFSKKQSAISCPICQAGMAAEMGSKLEHYTSHVRQIPPGHGDASGQYTWECVCGPAGMKWPREMELHRV
jgi:hypothetical protein